VSGEQDAPGAEPDVPVAQAALVQAPVAPAPAAHAVDRVRRERLARVTKRLRARGSRVERCPRCRVPPPYCFCEWRPRVETRAGFCLLMHDIEAVKPSNTGWLVADVVADTEAFEWTRTTLDPRLPALLAQPQWQPVLVFPAAYAAPERAIRTLALEPGRRPLFVLLDACWRPARRMFRRTPCLDALPVLDPRVTQASRYRLRQAANEGQLCTAEVAALCLRLADEAPAADALDAWLDVFVAHSMEARFHRAPPVPGEAHARCRAVDATGRR
jgi:DTW domain-containing protein YfiP